MGDLRELQPRLRPFAQRFVQLLESVGYRVAVTSVRRSTGKQQELWQRCKSGQSCFPAAYPGSSPHELGIAFDLQLTPPLYDGPGRLWESVGLRWGGRFSDPIHFDFYPRGHRPPGDPRSCRPRPTAAYLRARGAACPR